MLDPKSALLAMVLWVLVSTQFAGFSPTFEEMQPWGHWLSSVSFARWYMEDLFSSITRTLEDGWKGAPYWYVEPRG